MKKILVFCCFLSLTLNSALSETFHVVQQRPYINNPYYRHDNYYQTRVLPRDLTALEKYSMNKIYPRETPVERLERLENLAFGSTQSGDIQSRYHNVETAILSRPQQSFKRTVLGTLTNYFKGHPTGYTPSVYDGFYNYMPAYDNFIQNGTTNFGNTRINNYSNGIFGGGYSILNNSLGNGSSIRILD